MIPENIDAEHIQQALAEIDQEGIPPNRHSSTYDLVYDGKKYPPKLVLSIANKYANGEDLSPHNFKGGEGTDAFKKLDKLGFNIISKGDNPNIISDSSDEYEARNEDELKRILIQMGYEAAANYFTLLDEMKEQLKFIKDDPRVVFSLRSDQARISLIVGQRYCLSYVISEDNSWGFIHANENSSAGMVSAFEGGGPVAYYHQSSNYYVVKDGIATIIESTQKELNRSSKSSYAKYNNSSFAQAVFNKEYRNRLFYDVFELEDKFSWVQTHKEVAEELKKYRHRQTELIYILEEVGVETSTLIDEDETGRIRLKEIDPFTFFCLIHKYGDERRLKILQNVAEIFDASVPNDVHGIPTAYAQKAMLFPFKSDGRTNEIELLWEFFHVALNHKITDEIFNKILSIKGVAESKITEALFNIAPERYLPINGQTKPYLRKVLAIDTSFNSFQEYVDILNKVHVKTSTPFYQISREAWLWNTGKHEEVEGNNKLDTAMEQPLNHILYGPPGTGKTFALRNKYAPNFIEEQKLKTKAEFEVEKIEALSWWEVAAMTLLDSGNQTVPQIKEHRFIQIKENLSSSDNVNAILWSQLQSHTSLESENVNTANRQEPHIFDKKSGSVWSVNREDCQQKAPYLLVILSEIDEYESKTETKYNYRFTTFHQSYTYEDFVEGIKPKLGSRSDDSKSNEIEYTIEKGVFYQAADEACKLAGFLSLQDCLNRPKEEQEGRFKEAKPYGLFIDEINRGNISAILGELITLIEDDKRLTKENELIVQLPYSKDSFAVPPNLYIMGTLNTADRSVEALDTALRRRFSFTEKDPNPQLLKGVEVNGINIRKILETINLRIAKLLDRDHKIGHSYFFPLKENPDKRQLEDIFEDRVIPLLQEYFFGDFGRIGLVLGSSFVEELHSDSSGIFAGFSGYEEVAAEYEERNVYTIAPRNQWDFESIYAY